MKIADNWRLHHGRDPDKELRRLQHRFQAISRRHTSAPRRHYRGVNIWPLTIIATLVLYLVLAAFIPWLPSVALESGPYYRNCDAARAADAAPIYRDNRATGFLSIATTTA